MADKLINVEDFMNEVIKYPHQSLKTIGEALDKTPTVDAVPVIRCKDCKYRHESIMYGFECDKAVYPDEDSRNVFNGDWFCADGERNDGEQDAKA